MRTICFHNKKDEFRKGGKLKRILITGATGFIGANLARWMLARGHEVHILVRNGHKTWRIQNIIDDLHVWVADLNDPEKTLNAVHQIQPDWIFHLATYGAYSSQIDLNRMVETNLLCTANLINASLQKGFEVFINTGSSSEYGFKNHAPSEFEYLEPNSSYAITKAAATHYCSWVAQSNNACITTLRLYSVYGPFEEPTRLIPSVIVEGLNGSLPPLASPSIARDFIFIDDVLNAYQLVAKNPSIVNGKVYNIGSGIQTTLCEVIEHACRILPVNVKPRWGFMPDRQWDTNVWMADHTHISSDLNWQPTHLFGDGFKQTVDWFKTNEEMHAYYLRNRNLPG